MIQEFKTYLTAIKGYSEKTALAYGKDLRSFVKFMQEHDAAARWSTITREDVDAYIVHQQARGLKPATTNRHLAAIGALYAYMKRQGLDVESPTRYESRRKIENTLPNTISPDVLRKAYKKSAGVIHTILGVLMTTGVRVQEVLDIRVSDLDVMNKAIRISGKGGQHRLVYTTAEVMGDLVSMSKNGSTFARVFPTWEQRDVRSALFAILRPMTNAPQCSPHAIRHTFATEVAKGGTNVTTLALMMGHKSIKTTQKYIDMSQQMTQQAFTNYQRAIAQ